MTSATLERSSAVNETTRVESSPSRHRISVSEALARSDSSLPIKGANQAAQEAAINSREAGFRAPVEQRMERQAAGPRAPEVIPPPPEAKVAAENLAKSMRADAAGSELYRTLAGGKDAHAQISLDTSKEGASEQLKGHLGKLYSGMTPQQIVNNVTVYEGHRSNGKAMEIPEEMRADSSKMVAFLAEHMAKGNSLSLRHTNAALLARTTAGIAGDMSSDGKINVPSRNHQIDLANSERLMQSSLEGVAGQQFTSLVKGGNYEHPATVVANDAYLTSFQRYAMALSDSPSERNKVTQSQQIHGFLALREGQTDNHGPWERIFRPKAVADLDAAPALMAHEKDESEQIRASSPRAFPVVARAGTLEVDLNPIVAPSGITKQKNNQGNFDVIIPDPSTFKRREMIQAIAVGQPVGMAPEKPDPVLNAVIQTITEDLKKDGIPWAAQLYSPEQLKTMAEVEITRERKRVDERGQAPKQAMREILYTPEQLEMLDNRPTG